MVKSVYLANPYGFSLQQHGPLRELVAKLQSLGLEVFEPFERNNQLDKDSKGWAYPVGQADIADIQNTDGIVAVVNGCPPEEGVVFELGYATALKKAVFLFRDDARTCTPCENYPLNLMLFTALPEVGWERFWYTSLEELADPNKALVEWASQGKE
ncbi:MAG: nucleoside 2-deoxyribosyltransferase [Gammaproteobacteria bacterium]|nr:nucleoside 2-deoxyribosyltransferase [Gammaproteobacteria bacterium]